jgi:hypothetical protein
MSSESSKLACFCDKCNGRLVSRPTWNDHLKRIQAAVPTFDDWLERQGQVNEGTHEDDAASQGGTMESIQGENDRLEDDLRDDEWRDEENELRENEADGMELRHRKRARLAEPEDPNVCILCKAEIRNLLFT